MILVAVSWEHKGVDLNGLSSRAIKEVRELNEVSVEILFTCIIII